MSGSSSDSDSESVSELEVAGLTIVFMLRPGVEDIRAAVKRILAANVSVCYCISELLVYAFDRVINRVPKPPSRLASEFLDLAALTISGTLSGD